MKKFLVCPQCGIRRFYIYNENGEKLVVQVTFEKEIIPLNENQSIQGYNTEILYCLGCSWSGSIHSLVKY